MAMSLFFSLILFHCVFSSLDLCYRYHCQHNEELICSVQKLYIFWSYIVTKPYFITVGAGGLVVWASQKVVGSIPTPAHSPIFFCLGINCVGVDLCCVSLIVTLFLLSYSIYSDEIAFVRAIDSCCVYLFSCTGCIVPFSTQSNFTTFLSTASSSIQLLHVRWSSVLLWDDVHKADEHWLGGQYLQAC